MEYILRTIGIGSGVITVLSLALVVIAIYLIYRFVQLCNDVRDISAMLARFTSSNAKPLMPGSENLGKRECKFCGEKFDKSQSYCPYCGKSQ